MNVKLGSGKKHQASVAEQAAIIDAQELIIEIIDDHGVSQKELATMLGVSQSSISQLLSVRPKNLSVGRLGRVIHALGEKLILTTESRQHSAEDDAHNGCAWATTMIDEAVRRVDEPKYNVCNHANDDFAAEFGSSANLRNKRTVWRDRGDAPEVACK